MKFARTFSIVKNALLILALVATPLLQASSVSASVAADYQTSHHQIEQPSNTATSHCHDAAESEQSQSKGSPQDPNPSDPARTPSKCAFHCLSTALPYAKLVAFHPLPAQITLFAPVNVPPIKLVRDVDLRPPIS